MNDDITPLDIREAVLDGIVALVVAVENETGEHVAFAVANPATIAALAVPATVELPDGRSIAVTADNACPFGRFYVRPASALD